MTETTSAATVACTTCRERDAVSRGLCRRCYGRAHRHGDIAKIRAVEDQGRRATMAAAVDIDPRQAADALAARLVKARTEAGMSRDDAAALAGVSADQLGRWERGLATPTSRMLVAWAAGLGFRVGLVPVGAER